MFSKCAELVAKRQEARRRRRVVASAVTAAKFRLKKFLGLRRTYQPPRPGETGADRARAYHYRVLASTFTFAQGNFFSNYSTQAKAKALVASFLAQFLKPLNLRAELFYRVRRVQHLLQRC